MLLLSVKLLRLICSQHEKILLSGYKPCNIALYRIHKQTVNLIFSLEREIMARFVGKYVMFRKMGVLLIKYTTIQRKIKEGKENILSSSFFAFCPV